MGWLVGTEKKITDYTLIGTDGIVSVKGENHYMYYGDDGFIVRGYDYSGFKVNNRNHLKTVISYNSGNTLWGNLNSNLSVININGTATIPTMTVKAGTTTIGSRYVIRADSTYYEADVIVLKSLSGETWIKLPPPIIVDGVSYSFISGKSLKIKNLTSQKCYVYCESEPIYAPDGTGSAYYYSIGN